MESSTPKRGDRLDPVDADGDGDVTHTSIDVAMPDGPGDITKSELISAPGLGDFDLTPGVMLGEYKIEARAGEGGMGVVYAATHPMIGKRAAIKVLKKELCEDPYTVERFIDEARVVNQIGHPNIVDIFAFGEMPNGRSYFVMEWLSGESLRARLARPPRPTIAEVCSILKPLARALQAAHDKGVVHRDLKPDNIFLGAVDEDSGLRVKLLDFGIAKLAKTEPRLERTATGTMVGTPMYISPEQAKGHAIDHRADVYSLGAIAFEMLAGRTPFLADNAMEMVAKHLLEPPPTLGSVVRGVPPGLDRVVSAMINKDAAQRPTLAAFVQALDDAKALGATAPALLATPRDSVADLDVNALPTAASQKRTRWLLALAVVLVSAGVAFAITYATRDTTPVGSADRAGSADETAVAGGAGSDSADGSAGTAVANGTSGARDGSAHATAGTGTATGSTGATHGPTDGNAIDPDVAGTSSARSGGTAGGAQNSGTSSAGSAAGAGSARATAGTGGNATDPNAGTSSTRTNETTGSTQPKVTTPAAPKRGRVVITVKGAATAEFFVDGKRVASGKVLDTQLAYGDHDIEVRAGKQSEHVHVDVSAKTPPRTVVLKPEPKVDDTGLMEPGSIKR